jgi:hypothetical protein
MLSPARSTPIPIPGYNLSPPGQAEVCAALQRVFGAEKGTRAWAEVCDSCDLRPEWIRSRAELEQALAAWARLGGVHAVVARSMEIRLRTYDRLSARGVAPATGGAR